jgi:hypothetical protein
MAKPLKPIAAVRFAGMNNVKTSEGFFIDAENGIVEPRIILNADVDLQGRLVKRAGRTLRITLPGAHSLWACNSAMMCVANGRLYRIVQGAAVKIGSVVVDGPAAPVSYLEVEGRIYASNPYWKGIFNPADNTLSAWGVTPPPGPMMSSTTGSLPAGTYAVCYTNHVGGEMSGNGPISMITLAAAGGIQLHNRPTGAVVWMTDANESSFFRAGEVNFITELPLAEPLPSFLCGPPPFLENLAYAYGRIWGSSGPTVYYSEPFRFGWFKLTSNRFDFEDDVTLIAQVATGMFIGLKHKTFFLAGTEPSKMAQMEIGAGAVRGTLAYCNNMPYLADIMGTEQKVISNVPVWLSEDGFVAGNTAGRLFNLTKNKLRMGTPDHGASLYRDVNGAIQILTSFKQSGFGSSDAETVAALEAGKVVQSEATRKTQGSHAGFSDVAICGWHKGVESAGDFADSVAVLQTRGGSEI